MPALPNARERLRYRDSYRMVYHSFCDELIKMPRFSQVRERERERESEREVEFKLTALQVKEMAFTSTYRRALDEAVLTKLLVAYGKSVWMLRVQDCYISSATVARVAGQLAPALLSFQFRGTDVRLDMLRLTQRMHIPPGLTTCALSGALLDDLSMRCTRLQRVVLENVTAHVAAKGSDYGVSYSPLSIEALSDFVVNCPEVEVLVVQFRQIDLYGAALAPSSTVPALLTRHRVAGRVGWPAGALKVLFSLPKLRVLWTSMTADSAAGVLAGPATLENLQVTGAGLEMTARGVTMGPRRVALELPALHTLGAVACPATTRGMKPAVHKALYNQFPALACVIFSGPMNSIRKLAAVCREARASLKVQRHVAPQAAAAPPPPPPNMFNAHRGAPDGNSYSDEESDYYSDEEGFRY